MSSGTVYQKLWRLFNVNPVAYCTANEYLRAANITAQEFAQAIAPLQEAGAVGFESINGEVYVRTAPHGRPVTGEYAELGANMWEHLRRKSSVAKASALHKQIRALEKVGWKIHVTAEHVPGAYLVAVGQPCFSVELKGGALVPILDLSLEQITHDAVAPWHKYGIKGVGIVCSKGMLSETATKIKKIQRGGLPMYFLALEEPRYDPVIFTPDDVGLLQ